MYVLSGGADEATRKMQRSRQMAGTLQSRPSRGRGCVAGLCCQSLLGLFEKNLRAESRDAPAELPALPLASLPLGKGGLGEQEAVAVRASALGKVALLGTVRSPGPEVPQCAEGCSPEERHPAPAPDKLCGASL